MENEKLQRERRKYSIALHISGAAVIAFNAWNVIRNIAGLYLAGGWDAAKGGADVGATTWIIVCIITGIIVAVDFVLRIYVGLCAMKEAKGKRKGMGYVVITILMILMEASMSAVYIFAHTVQKNTLDATVSTIVEITCILNMCGLVYSAMKIKKSYREKTEQEEAA